MRNTKFPSGTSRPAGTAGGRKSWARAFWDREIIAVTASAAAELKGFMQFPMARHAPVEVVVDGPSLLDCVQGGGRRTVNLLTDSSVAVGT